MILELVCLPIVKVSIQGALANSGGLRNLRHCAGSAFVHLQSKFHLVAACNEAPTIDNLEEDSYPLVEQVLTEDDTEALSHRLDRYTLDNHPDELNYTGTAKVTEFKKTTAEDGTVQVDSTKYYVDVVINFHGTDYDKYTVNVYRDE